MGIPEKAHKLYAVRLWKMRDSVIFPLYGAVCKAIHAYAGDLVLVWVHPPFITLRLADLGNIRPADHFQRDELIASLRTLEPELDAEVPR